MKWIVGVTVTVLAAKAISDWWSDPDYVQRAWERRYR